MNWAIGMRFGWFESVAVQGKRYKAVDAHLADHWLTVLGYELESRVMANHWRKYGRYYHPDLRASVHEIRPDLQPMEGAIQPR